MAKSFIHIRVDDETKKAIEEAAHRKGESITQFVLDAATNAAKESAARTTRKKKKRGGEPYVFFVVACRSASRGGRWGYGYPAYHLAAHLDKIPEGTDPSAWAKEKKALRSLLKDGDDEGVWDWFVEHFETGMDLVPPRRWRQFVSGVDQAFAEGKL